MPDELTQGRQPATEAQTDEDARYAALEARVAATEARLTALETGLADSVPTVLFQGLRATIPHI